MHRISNKKIIVRQLKTVFRIRIQLNPDPAKNLNPDPEELESGSESKLFLNTTGI